MITEERIIFLLKSVTKKRKPSVVSIKQETVSMDLKNDCKFLHLLPCMGQTTKEDAPLERSVMTFTQKCVLTSRSKKVNVTPKIVDLLM